MRQFVATTVAAVFCTALIQPMPAVAAPQSMPAVAAPQASEFSHAGPAVETVQPSGSAAPVNTSFKFEVLEWTKLDQLPPQAGVNEPLYDYRYKFRVSTMGAPSSADGSLKYCGRCQWNVDMLGGGDPFRWGSVHQKRNYADGSVYYTRLTGYNDGWTSVEASGVTFGPETVKGLYLDFMWDDFSRSSQTVDVWYLPAPKPPMVPSPQTLGVPCDASALDSSTAVNNTESCGYPVNTATGNEAFRVVDAAVQAPGVPFQLSRTYNSLGPGTGTLGTGWSHSLAANLSLQGGTGTYRGPGGEEIAYLQLSDGTFVRPPGVRGVLSQIGSEYRLVNPDGRAMTFNASGQLVKMVDRSEVGLTITNVNGRPVSVTDAAGRTSTLTYRTDGLLDRVTLHDGRFVQYSYTGGALTGVRDLRGKTWTYGYDSRGLLNLIRDPLGHEVRTTYDPVTSRVTSQVDPRGKTTTYAWDAAFGVSTTTLPDGGVRQEQYYGNVLVLRVDERGYRTRYEYDASANLTQLTDGRGNSTVMTYDDRGNMLTRTAPAPLSHVDTWTYNGNNTVASVRDGRGKTTTFAYTAAGLLERSTDPSSAVTSYTYTPVGRPATVTDGRGKITRYEYDAAYNLTAVVSARGKRTTFGYDASGRMTSSVDPAGNETGALPADFTTRMNYDNGDLLLSTTDPYGKVTTQTYDDAGRLSTVTDPLNRTTTLTRDGAGNVTTRTDAKGGVWTTTYDDVGRTASTTDARGTTTYTPDKTGNVTSLTTARGNAAGATAAAYTWTYEYDANGNEISASHPTAGVTRTTYDALNRVSAVEDANGGITRTTYDAAGNVLTTTNPEAEVTTIDYDDAGRVRQVHDPRNAAWTTRYSYDPNGNRISQVAADGGTTTWAYDDDGHLSSMTEPRGNVVPAPTVSYTTTYGVDAAGRQTRVTSPLGHAVAFTYDRAGRVASQTDARAAVTSYAYHPDGALQAVTGPSTAGTTTYGYDLAGNLTSRTDALTRTTSWTYGNAHELLEMKLPTGRTWTYGYDPELNHTLTVTPAGTSTTTTGDGELRYNRDPLGRVTATTASDASVSTTVAYDPLGNRTRTVDTNGAATDYDYDLANRLLRTDHVTASGHPATAMTFAYDDAGNVTSRGYPDGTSQGATYDSVGRLATVTHAGSTIGTYGYDIAGNPVSLTYPAANGHVERNTYDRSGRLTEVAHTKGTATLARFVYTLDAEGNPTRTATTRGTTTTTSTATFDDMNRLTRSCPLTTCTSTSASYIAYTYDKVGNRTQENRVGQVPTPGLRTYTYNTNDELATVAVGTAAPVTATQDANGNITADGTGLNYAYNLADQLTRVTEATGARVDYTYDTTGLRSTRRTTSASGVTAAATGYQWDPTHTAPELATERTLDATGSWLRSHVHGLDPLATSSGSALTYLHTDRMGSVTDTTSSAGVATTRTTYDPYGARTQSTLVAGTPAPTFGYTGEMTDPTSGDIYLRARSLDPTTGRFLSRDPLAAPHNQAYTNTYHYAFNRPTVMVDPTGQTAQWVKDAVRGVGDAAYDAGVGMLNLPYIIMPPLQVATSLGYQSPVQNYMNQELATVKDRLDTWGGGCTDTIANRVGYVGGFVGTAAIGGGTGSVIKAARTGRAAAPMRMPPSVGGGSGYVDLASPARRSHILDGEVRPNGTIGGGHRGGTGYPNKSEFPTSWSDDQIMHSISDIATDPSLTWRAGPQQGDFFVDGIRENVEITVLIRRNEIWTAYPTNLGRNAP